MLNFQTERSPLIDSSAIFCKRLVLILALTLLTTLPATLWAVPVQSEDKRFTDHQDGSITDTQTGLMWFKNDSYLQIGHWLSWLESIMYIKQMNDTSFAGYSDWRMPTVEELKTLYEPEKVNSQQAGTEMIMYFDPIFGKNGSGSLWSSTSNGAYNAFGVVFNTGKAFSSNRSNKARKGVRPVRNQIQ
ncbi:MAG: DUF1566 domain-containing protein [Candidatus Nitrohelix vancouverensis]|uniref:DUF1566 domain-containing protein n=1 Tax=Candidatus Nitrohelix vancouverensis TaxID=2705534 RepID=A0A7T0C4G6_9BACT|nr:MAG: DUF1566 domain-containing protein [Candidatus Nitrohelix vancouverensis]